MNAQLNVEQLRKQAKEQARERRAAGAPTTRLTGWERSAVRITAAALFDLGADPTIRDAIHGGMADGWADFGGHSELAALLREHA